MAEFSPLPVLHYIGSLTRGGAEEHLLTLLQGMDPRRFELHLACAPELMARLEADLPPSVRRLPLRLRPGDWRSAAAFCQYLRRHRIAVAHSHLFFSSRLASPLARWCGARTVETPHVRESWRRGWRSWYAPDRLLGRAVDVYIAVSRANATYLIEEKRLPAHKVRVVPNGIALRRFLKLPDRERLRREHGWDPQACIVLSAARLEPQKGHAVLLEALAQIRAVCPRLRLVCAGEGSCRPALAGLTARLGLENQVQWVGYQNPIEPWLAMADVFVLPSFYEGLPLAAMEAMAAGLAVVASAVDGTRELIESGRNGWLLPPGNAGEFAQALQSLYRDAELRRRLGREARAWAFQNCGADRQLRATGRIYLQLSRNGRPEATSAVTMPAERETESWAAPATASSRARRWA